MLATAWWMPPRHRRRLGHPGSLARPLPDIRLGRVNVIYQDRNDEVVPHQGRYNLEQNQLESITVLSGPQ